MKIASCVSPCQNLTNVANCVVQWDFVGSWRNIKMLRHFAKVSQRSHWINLLISSSTYFVTSAFFKECSYCQGKLAPRIWKQEDFTREPESQNYGLCVKHSVKNRLLKSWLFRFTNTGLYYPSQTKADNLYRKISDRSQSEKCHHSHLFCSALYPRKLPITGDTTSSGTLTPRLDSLHALQEWVFIMLLRFFAFSSTVDTIQVIEEI